MLLIFLKHRTYPRPSHANFLKKNIYAIEFIICGGTDLNYDSFSYSMKVTFLGKMPTTVFTCQVGNPSQTGFLVEKASPSPNYKS